MSEEKGQIKAIDKTSVHRICSGQVVLTLAGAVKELVENSIDAESTNIEVRLKEYGFELIEVIDNGSGVKACDFENLTLKHHTSKLTDFSDLSTVGTFGFRGEALSSLCALSNLAIVTCHKDATIGSRLEYDHHGTLVNIVPTARQTGTTVIVKNLFSTLPVRHKEFQRNLKKEYAKMIQLLTAYCLICTSKRITCSNTSDKGRKNILLSTSGSQAVKENIISVFGGKQVNSLMEFVQCDPSPSVLEEFSIKEVPEDYFRVEGFISSCVHGEGRSTADRQFFYINGRPCDLQKVTRVINDVYHSFNRHQYPFVFLNIILLKGLADVNVTPDKRQIFIPEEKLLLAIIKTSILNMYENQPSILKHCSPSVVKNCSKEGSMLSVFSKLIQLEEDKNIYHSNCKRSLLECEKDTKDDLPQPHIKNPRLADTLNSRTICFDSSQSSSINNNELESISSSNTNNSGNFTEHVDTSQKMHSFTPEDSLCNFLKNENVKNNENSSEMTSQEISPHVCDIVSYNQEKQDISMAFNNTNSDSSDQINFTVTLPFPEEKIIDKVKSKDFDPTRSSVLNNIMKFSRGVQKRGPYKKHTYPTVEKSLLGRKTSWRKEKANTSSSSEDVNIDDVIQRHKLELDNRILRDCSTVQNKESSSTRLEVNTDELVDNQEDFISSNMENPAQSSSTIEEINDADVPLTRRRKTVCLDFTMESIREKMEKKEVKSEGLKYRKFRSKILPTDNKTAEDELQKEVSKDMFAQMEIIGQFNLGFIITKYNDDLFIVDQHASDEKYNFEILQRDTVLETQKLLSPQVLELTAASETTLLENIHIFEKNGFKFNVIEDSKPGQRIQLLSVPVSQNWSFGKEDVDELIFMLTDNSGQMCRPSRICQMFASRACRKSVMIGTSLSHQIMKKLVCHMGEIEQPWNCPHGRPTMRHLFNMNLINRFSP